MSFFNQINNYLKFNPKTSSGNKAALPFKIHINTLKKITKKNTDYTSYTFLISDTENFDYSIVKNLVINHSKNKMEVFVLTYNAFDIHDNQIYNISKNLVIEQLFNFDISSLGTLTAREPVNQDENGTPTSNENPSSGGAYCYSVTIEIRYPCAGVNATNDHYYGCGCDGTSSCQLPHSVYSYDTFCTSDFNATTAATTYVATNNLSSGGSGNPNITTTNSNIIISSIIQNQVPEGANPLAFKLGLDTLSEAYYWLENTATEEQYNQIGQFLEKNKATIEAKELANLFISFFILNPNISWNDIMNNRFDFFDYKPENENDYTIGGYDNTYYDYFNVQQTWTTINSVIPVSKFIGWNRAAHPNWECMDYAKEQLRVMGYQISGYKDIGQTFQVYTAQNGVNQTQLKAGLDYLKYALSNSIPIIVGVDNKPGHPGNLDNTTDHFIVVVGMGQDSNGKYFQFYDNASGLSIQGANYDNKLYYNSTSGLIVGESQTNYAINNNLNPYKITMIRKSKPL